MQEIYQKYEIKIHREENTKQYLYFKNASMYDPHICCMASLVHAKIYN